jgi:hypothetical protein
MPRQSHATKLKKAKATITGADAAQIERMEKELAELQATQSKQLEALQAQSGLEEWRKISAVKEKMLKEIEKISTLPGNTAISAPNWFEFVDPENKKRKSLSEDADWIKEQLKGKSADQKNKILAAMRDAAEEQRVVVWTRFSKTKKRKTVAKKKTATAKKATPTPSAAITSNRKIS